MTAQQVKELAETTRAKLKEAIAKAELFLNFHSLKELGSEKDADTESFYRGFLTDLRHLLVFSEVAYERLGVALRRPHFNEEQAEKILYEVYHQCVNRFFYPQNECYSEDGRYAYTGQDAIRFRKKPNRAVRDITMDLSKIYEELRENLAYYEVEYADQRRLQGQKV